MIRMQEKYVLQDGTLNQAGYSALHDTEVSVASLQAGLAATDAALAADIASSRVKLQTPVSASSQTEIDFTGIPSWVNRVTVLPAGLSTNGTSVILIQLGTSVGVEATGYDSAGAVLSGGAGGNSSSTAGFHIVPNAASNTLSGAVTLTKTTGDTWVASGVVKRAATAVFFVSGDKTLAGVLDRVRITTGGGTDTFDAGSVNISWE